MTRRLLFALGLTATLAGCASSSAGAGGGAFGFDDCYDDDCIGYAGGGYYYLYPRTPGTVTAPRQPVVLSENSRPSPRTVNRSSVTSPARSYSAPRTSPAPPSSPHSTTAAPRR